MGELVHRGRVVKSYTTEELVPVVSACISPDDQIIVSCHQQKILVWNTESCKIIGTMLGHRSDITCCSITHDLLVTGSENGIIHLWKYQDMKGVAKIGTPLGRIRSCSIAPNGRFLSVATDSTQLRIYTLYGVDGGAMLQGLQYTEISGHTEAINDVNYSNNGQHVLTASDDGSVRLWKNDSSGDCIRNIDQEEGPVYQAAFSTKNKYIVFMTSKGITVWDMANNYLQWTVPGEFQIMTCSNANDSLVAVTPGGRLLCYSIGAKKETVRKGTAHNDIIISMAMCNSGYLFFTGGNDGKMFLWE